MSTPNNSPNRDNIALIINHVLLTERITTHAEAIVLLHFNTDDIRHLLRY